MDRFRPLGKPNGAGAQFDNLGPLPDLNPGRLERRRALWQEEYAFLPKCSMAIDK